MKNNNTLASVIRSLLMGDKTFICLAAFWLNNVIRMLKYNTLSIDNPRCLYSVLSVVSGRVLEGRAAMLHSLEANIPMWYLVFVDNARVGIWCNDKSSKILVQILTLRVFFCSKYVLWCVF